MVTVRQFRPGVARRLQLPLLILDETPDPGTDVVRGAAQPRADPRVWDAECVLLKSAGAMLDAASFTPPVSALTLGGVFSIHLLTSAGSPPPTMVPLVPGTIMVDASASTPPRLPSSSSTRTNCGSSSRRPPLPEPRPRLELSCPRRIAWCPTCCRRRGRGRQGISTSSASARTASCTRRSSRWTAASSGGRSAARRGAAGIVRRRSCRGTALWACMTRASIGSGTNPACPSSRPGRFGSTGRGGRLLRQSAHGRTDPRAGRRLAAPRPAVRSVERRKYRGGRRDAESTAGRVPGAGADLPSLQGQRYTVVGRAIDEKTLGRW